MNHDTEERIAKLEKEVLSLRMELNELKGIKTDQAKESSKDDVEPNNPRPILQTEETENHLVNLNKKALSSQKKNPIVAPISSSTAQVQNEKKHRSLEEMILWLLPKVFMLILVLGVLWGLKVISDIGVLTNSVKILLAYILSLGLIAVAVFMDRRKPESSRIFTVVLYGGAFIVGILTTAAGAILYDVLNLSIALILAFCYIAYGMLICYVKKNQVLSIFVVFTSLLLPYLLEYMDFNGAVIVFYVLIVFCSMQLIFLKHHQSIAMYCSYFFSTIALFVIWNLNRDGEWLYLLSFILLNTVLLAVWWRLYKPFSKRRTIHEGLLFSLSLVTIIMINQVADAASIPLLAMTFIYAAAAALAYKQSSSRILDIMATLSLLTVMNIVVALELGDSLEQLLLPFTAFLGLLLSLKLNAYLMKVIYSLIFGFNILIHLLSYNVEPFWSAAHLNYVLIFVYLLILFIQLKRFYPKTHQEKEDVMISFANDFFPIVITVYFFIYIAKIDLAYLSNNHYPYITLLLLAIAMTGSLFIAERFIGRFLRWMLLFAFALGYFYLLPTHYVEGLDVWLNLFVRLLYVLIIIAIIGDLYMKGYIYKSWISKTKIDIDGTMAAGIFFAMVLGYSILEQFKYDYMSYSLAVITLKTLLLFMTATISLWISSTGQYRNVRILGFILIPIAMMKLIFFDLDSLDLVVRAILFMVIGGIGLFLSNRLLSRKAEDKE
ncbi:DUF2339 domain-containing protein [Lysinibacillus yapensis]|uniref:DUF2339 domain-containing protein n=1 Tax=Ureibacillus yapensis TaxID=2304605 RepID=A0A396SHT1_9BACL|nr:DUF2339 domain-containing protein [Lysinibacillus yapensis]RHW38275.1 DUF2339 domain-containing protein [Lysinibacillus yapensis]